MKNIHIKVPIWMSKSVGIKDSRITDDILVTIGNSVYPHKYFMKKAKAKKYPEQTFKGNLAVRVIPIDDFEIRL